MNFDYNHIEIPEEVRKWINRLPGYDGINIRENTFTNQERWLLGRTDAQIFNYAKSDPFSTCPLYPRAAATTCKLDCAKQCGSHECWEVFNEWASTPICKPELSAQLGSPMVFICSPFAGTIEANVTKALKYCRFAVGKGKFPITPHCYFPRFMDDGDPAERELAISFGIKWLYGCRELWIFGEHISEGMKKEILAAKWKGIKIRRFDENMEEMRYETTS
jgi:hypothetical protein